MTIKPKRARPLQQLRGKAMPDKFCENPGCGAKLSRERARKGGKYCDRICRNEHARLQALERRPKEIRCAFCNKEIDVMREKPSYWIEHELHFCDGVCVDGYRRQTGKYQEMSKLGNEKAAEYKEKHGQIVGYEDRAAATSRGNKEKPPKAKHFIREGKAWGYDVKFYPYKDRYRVSVPELDEELGSSMTAKTVKEGLRMVRARIVQLRVEESRTG